MKLYASTCSLRMFFGTCRCLAILRTCIPERVKPCGLSGTNSTYVGHVLVTFLQGGLVLRLPFLTWMPHGKSLGCLERVRVGSHTLPPLRLQWTSLPGPSRFGHLRHPTHCKRIWRPGKNSHSWKSNAHMVTQRSQVPQQAWVLPYSAHPAGVVHLLADAVRARLLHADPHESEELVQPRESAPPYG